MSKRILIFFVVALAALNAGIMGWSYAAARTWLGNDEHRLPNIRLVDDACQSAFIREFIALQDWSKPTLLVLGDSQPFNDKAPLETTWHFALAKDFGLHPVSMAVIDGRPEDSAYIAGLLRQAGLRAEIATMNINHSHFAKGASRRLVAETGEEPFDFFRCAVKMRRQILSDDLPLPGRGGLRQKFRKGPLQPDRYDTDLRRAKAILAEPLEALKQVASRPIAYVTANNIEAFADYGFDLEKYKKASRTLRDICLLTLDECIDASRSLGAGNFYDIVHFNNKGNRYFPGVLKRGLKTPALSAPAPPGQ